MCFDVRGIMAWKAMGFVRGGPVGRDLVVWRIARERGQRRILLLFRRDSGGGALEASGGGDN